MLSREMMRAALHKAGVREWTEPEFGAYQYATGDSLAELHLIRLLGRQYLAYATNIHAGMHDTQGMAVRDIVDIINLTCTNGKERS